MIKITLTLDYKSYVDFVKSCWSGYLDKLILSPKCISWSYMEDSDA